MTVDFEDSVLRLERAAKQLDAFEDDVTAFLNANPSGYSVDQDRQSGLFTVRLAVSAQPPKEWRVTLQEIVGNLRSPFDYVAVALADAHGGHDNRTAFPIYAKSKQYREKVAAKTRNIPDLALRMIEAVQPYHGGDYQRLDVLRRLDDDGKHKRLHTATSGAVDTALGIVSVQGGLFIVKVYGPALENGDPLVTFMLDGQAHMDPVFTPQVVLGKGTAAQGHPVISTLREIHETTTVVIDQFVQAFG